MVEIEGAIGVLDNTGEEKKMNRKWLLIYLAHWVLGTGIFIWHEHRIGNLESSFWGVFGVRVEEGIEEINSKRLKMLRPNEHRLAVLDQ